MPTSLTGNRARSIYHAMGAAAASVTQSSEVTAVRLLV
jgi:hypothetical protein